MTIKIGIDIDDTITNTNDLIKELMIRNNLKEEKLDFDSYDDGKLNKYDKLIRQNICDVLSNCKLRDNSKEVIDYFKNIGCKIILITARSNHYSDNVYDITVNYLKNNNIYYDELLFGYSDKVDICVEKGIDIMLDDNYTLISKLNNTNVKGVLFETSYNKIYNYNGDSVDSWLEFKKFVDNFKNII
ncbi:MAG: hypothetical protein PUD59_02735 [bacterium]|nr:hypothetical protein [bacterium]